MRVENGELRVKSKMSGMNVKTLIIPLFLVLFCCVFGCRNKQHSTTDESARDLPQIKDSGELVVLTLYSSTSYFIYRGQEMGFQYELSEQFAKSLGLKLRIEVAKSVDEMIQKLLAGEGDMIAYNLPITKEWKDSLLYCGEDVITHQVIVQQGRGKQKPLKDVTELVGKDIYVKPGKYYDRLVNLNSELGGGIRIHEVTNDSTTIEDLITQVAQGKIPYTVADNDLAKLNKTYYPNLNIDLSISFDQRSSWAVRKDSPELAAATTKWHQENMTSPAYTASMKRYFENSKMMPHSPILSLKEGKISHYDDLFRKYSKDIGWDWRMLASLAYTESNFDTTAVSWAGAKGLMQLMPATARAMGVPPGKEQNPEESVKEVIRGFGAHMMNTQISNTNRFQSADAVGTLMNCILNTTKNSWQFKKMDRNNNIHLQNVRYLLNRLDAAESNEEKNREEVAV